MLQFNGVVTDVLMHSRHSIKWPCEKSRRRSSANGASGGTDWWHLWSYSAGSEGALQGGLKLATFRYPTVYRNESVKDTYFGVDVDDPYRWLEAPEPSITADCKAQRRSKALDSVSREKKR